MDSIKPSTPMEIKVQLSSQTPKQMQKSLKGLNDSERQYLLNILKNAPQTTNSDMEARIADKVHLYTRKPTNTREISKINKIMANFMGERISSKELATAFKQWQNHMSPVESTILMKRMGEVKNDPSGRNLRDRQFSTTVDASVKSNLSILGLLPGASLDEAITAYKKDCAKLKEEYKNFPPTDSAIVQARRDNALNSQLHEKLTALTNLHVAYDNYHEESCKKYAEVCLENPPGRDVQVRHYATIGVHLNATQEEINTALKMAALKYHPDKPGGSKEMMQKVVAAKEAFERSNAPHLVLGINRGQSLAEINQSFKAKMDDPDTPQQKRQLLVHAKNTLDRLHGQKIFDDLHSRLNG